MAESSISVSGLPTRPTDGYCMICDALYPLADGGHSRCIERARQALALLPEVLEQFDTTCCARGLECADCEKDRELLARIRALIGGE